MASQLSQIKGQSKSIEITIYQNLNWYDKMFASAKIYEKMIEEVWRNILCFIKNYNSSFDIYIHCSSNNRIDNVAIRAKNQLCIIWHGTCGIVRTSCKMKITLNQILKNNIGVETYLKKEKPLTTCPTLTRSSIS